MALKLEGPFQSRTAHMEVLTMSAKTLIRRSALALGLFLIPPMAGSVQTPLVNEDIDLFLAGSGNESCGCANVLIILDNGSYWSNTYTLPDGTNTTKIDMEKAALAAVIPQLNDKIRLGIMMGGQTGADSQYSAPNNNSKVQGGVIRYAMRPMNATNRASLLTFIAGLDKTSDKSSSDPSYARMMHTSFEYFGGKSLFLATPWFLPGFQPTGLCSGGGCLKYITPTSGSILYPPYSSSGVGTLPN